MSYIGPDEFVFNHDSENGIYSGGFNVNSIFMKEGMSPIMTLNTEVSQNGGSQVSDIFNDLVIPSWSFSYNGGSFNGGSFNGGSKYDSDDDVIEDDIHDKLLDLVKHHETESKHKKKNSTRKKNQKVKKSRPTKKNF